MVDAEIANYVVNLIKECLCNKKTAFEETLCIPSEKLKLFKRLNLFSVYKFETVYLYLSFELFQEQFNIRFAALKSCPNVKTLPLELISSFGHGFSL